MIEQKDPCEEQLELEHLNVTILLNGPAFMSIPLVGGPDCAWLGWGGYEDGLGW